MKLFRLALSICAILTALAPPSTYAQDEGMDIADIGFTTDRWRGEVFQRGERFRCKTIRNAMDRGSNRAACERAIECYQDYIGYTLPKVSPPRKWRRVGPPDGIWSSMNNCQGLPHPGWRDTPTALRDYYTCHDREMERLLLERPNTKSDEEFDQVSEAAISRCSTFFEPAVSAFRSQGLAEVRTWSVYDAAVALPIDAWRTTFASLQRKFGPGQAKQIKWRLDHQNTGKTNAPNP